MHYFICSRQKISSSTLLYAFKNFTVKLGELEKFNNVAQEDTKTEEETITNEVELDNIGIRLMGLNKQLRSKYNFPKNVKGVVILLF